MDLNNTQQIDSSFNIEAGVNNYILSKNRYIKNIIEIDKFENENIKRVFELNQHSFDPHWSQVSGLGGPGISDYIYNYRKWIAVYSTKFAESFGIITVVTILIYLFVPQLIFIIILMQILRVLVFLVVLKMLK